MRNGNEPERFLFCFPDFMYRLESTGLSPGEQGAWLRLLLRQLRYGYTYSTFHPAAGYPKRRVQRFIQAGLLERHGDELHIVDWEGWNGRREYKRLLNRERQQRFRDRRKLSNQNA